MRKSGKTSAIVLLTSLIAFLEVIPFFKMFEFFNIILFILNVSCSTLLFGIHLRMKQKMSVVWFVAHVGFIYVFMLAVFTKNFELIGRFSEYLILANSFQVLIYCKRNSLKNELYLLVRLLILVLAFTCFTTLIGHSIDPSASRMLSDNPELYSKNIGGYGFVYSLLFFVIAIQVILTPGNYLNKRVIYWMFVLFICVMTLFSSRFFIAGMLIFGILFVSYFIKRPPFIFKIWILWATLGVSAFTGVFSIALWLYQNENYLIIKGYEALLAILYNSDSSYLSERLLKYSISMRGFSEFPLLGVVAAGEDIFNWEWYGRHSYILDNFALFGFFGGGISVFILIYPWRIYRHYFGLDLSSTFLAVCLIIMIGLTNILTPEILIAAYLILPATALLKTIETKDGNKESVI